jgi:hypothetical protein
MNQKRSPSGYVVTEVDVMPAVLREQDAFRARTKKLGHCLETNFRYAYIEIEERLFFIDSEGAEQTLGHVSDDLPATIQLYEAHDNMKAIFASQTVTLTPMEIKALPVLRTLPLEEHIRTFGTRLEKNYNLWMWTLNRATEGKPTRRAYQLKAEGQIISALVEERPEERKILDRIPRGGGTLQGTDIDDFLKVFGKALDTLEIIPIDEETDETDN